MNVFDWLQDVEIPDLFAGFDTVKGRFKGFFVQKILLGLTQTCILLAPTGYDPAGA